MSSWRRTVNLREVTRYVKMALDNRYAIVAGTSVFVVLAFPTAILAFFLAGIDTTGPTAADIIEGWVLICLYALLSVFLGLGIARRSRRLKFLSLCFFLAAVGFWVLMAIVRD